MIDALLELPSHLRERLMSALESGLLQGAPTGAALRSVLGTSAANDAVAEALGELARQGVRGQAAAAWIRAVNKAGSRTPQLDLVWSGPEVAGLHARDTRRVYEEIIGSAEHSLWISTYVFFDGQKAFDVLARRMDSTPGLRVTLLLNIQRKRGDTTDADHLVRKFAERFWTKEWPGSARPQLYYDPRSLELEIPGGVLHAKAVVADGQTVFITSANLTEAALERNIELGILVRDSALAQSVNLHFQGLVEARLLKPLPSQ